MDNDANNAANAAADAPSEETKIKVGEVEYSQDDLTRLVGLGSKAVELEEKWNTKIDRLMPEYTRTTQELSTLRGEKEALAKEKADWEAKNKSPEQQDAETLRREALAEAKSLGLMTSEDFEAHYQQRREAERKLDEVTTLTKQMKDDGNPVVEVQDLLQYMVDNDIRNPRIAYKEMFETELDKIKEDKLKAIKGPEFSTTTQTTAGGKKPEEVTITNQNLKSLLKEVVNRES